MGLTGVMACQTGRPSLAREAPKLMACDDREIDKSPQETDHTDQSPISDSPPNESCLYRNLS